jgi:tRNA pseudouridine38-40 synthase
MSTSTLSVEKSAGTEAIMTETASSVTDTPSTIQQPENKKRNPDWKAQNKKKREKGKTQSKHRAWWPDNGPNEEASRESQKPHAGSFANPEMRALFGVTIDDREAHSEDHEKRASPMPEVAQPINDLQDDAVASGSDMVASSEERRFKKRVAMLLGYVGTRYGGFQMNENQRTIQAELELALFRAKFIGASNFGYTHKYGWSTSGRTDKGVHACAQVVSLKIELTAATASNEIIRDRINDCLPPDIRIFDVAKVTKSFCAHTQRDCVRYQYLIPSFMLVHPTKLREWFVQEECAAADGTISKQRVLSDPLSADEIQRVKSHLRDHRASPNQLKCLREALQAYEGTHYFHNYSKGVKSSEGRAQRYVVSFVVEDPVLFESTDGSGSTEWIPTQVIGQSFLLHQIRKMISMAVDVARGAATMQVLERALSRDFEVNLNVAPAQGLYLDMSFYEAYNNRIPADYDVLEWSDEGNRAVYERWKSFRHDVIMKHGKPMHRVHFLRLPFCSYLFVLITRCYQLSMKKSEMEILCHTCTTRSISMTIKGSIMSETAAR